jgi:hypothetical protein
VPSARRSPTPAAGVSGTAAKRPAVGGPAGRPPPCLVERGAGRRYDATAVTGRVRRAAVARDAYQARAAPAQPPCVCCAPQQSPAAVFITAYSGPSSHHKQQLDSVVPHQTTVLCSLGACVVGAGGRQAAEPPTTARTGPQQRSAQAETRAQTAVQCVYLISPPCGGRRGWHARASMPSLCAAHGGRVGGCWGAHAPGRFVRDDAPHFVCCLRPQVPGDTASCVNRLHNRYKARWWARMPGSGVPDWQFGAAVEGRWQPTRAQLPGGVWCSSGGQPVQRDAAVNTPAPPAGVGCGRRGSRFAVCSAPPRRTTAASCRAASPTRLSCCCCCCCCCCCWRPHTGSHVNNHHGHSSRTRRGCRTRQQQAGRAVQPAGR